MNDEEYQNIIKDWDSRFFNTLEWLAFLINEGEIKMKNLINFFKPAIIRWYEELFLTHMDDEVKNGPTQFNELCFYSIINHD